MKLLYETDIYASFNNGAAGTNALTNKTKEILAGNNAQFLTYEDLEPALNMMKKQYKEPVVLKMITAIQKGRLIPFYANTKAVDLPTFLPFVKYKKEGMTRVAVDLTHNLVVTKDPDSGYKTYTIDNKFLYCRLLPAFLNLELFDKTYTLNPQSLEITAGLWARMFCKVLNRSISLNTSKDRYEAFNYFAIRFFLSYIMECPPKIVDDISEKYLAHGKTYTINNMELTIANKGYEINKDFNTFCTTLFNNEVSNIKGIRSANISESISAASYMKDFIIMYDQSSIFALAAFPYFFHVIFSTNVKAGFVSDNAFEDIIKQDNRDYAKLLNMLFAEV